MQIRQAIESINDYEIGYKSGDTPRPPHYGVRLCWDVFLRDNRFDILVKLLQQSHQKEMVSRCFRAN